PAGSGTESGPNTGSVSPPTLPAPTTPWAQRQPVLKRYVRWLVHGCGVTQVATARVLNSTGQRTPKGRPWQPSTVSALLNGRYDRGAAACR
ncbi:MAG: recombinase family protein, partial [Sciscionella sp.]